MSVLGNFYYKPKSNPKHKIIKIYHREDTHTLSLFGPKDEGPIMWNPTPQMLKGHNLYSFWEIETRSLVILRGNFFWGRFICGRLIGTHGSAAQHELQHGRSADFFPWLHHFCLLEDVTVLHDLQE